MFEAAAIMSTTDTQPSPPERPLDLVHISIHGLIRGENLELGRDPDTGGQCLYVLELARALARDPAVKRLTLLTRRVVDSRLSADYARDREPLADRAEIVRIDAGPRRYLRKEVLWRHLDAFIDGTLAYFRRERRVPDLIHAHYADAGYVGRQLAAVLDCPFVFTGHSLGRVKRERLREGGAAPEELEQKYNIAARIEAEELSLDAASLVCTSTRQEVDEQYSMYDQYAADRMRVIPPGVDLDRFDGPADPETLAAIEATLAPFLRDPAKPAVLTIARADERKNLPGLVRAFSGNPWLREHTNLVIIAGNREVLEKLPPGTRRVWSDLLRAIDDGDLYGSVAYPKRHRSREVAGFFRWAAARGGVFVNPAFTEPFGLTLLEAAAAGLPLVATNDGGPRDILANCRNGTLVDPLDENAMGEAIREIIADPARHREFAERGHAGVRRHYSWEAHVKSYLAEVRKIIPAERPVRTSGSRGTLVERGRWIVMDLLPKIEGESAECRQRWRDLFETHPVGFGIATALSFDEAWQVIRRCGMPEPGFVISNLGGEIRYGRSGVPDERWQHQVAVKWNREKVVNALAQVAGIRMQGEKFQHRFKISYVVDPVRAPNRAALQRVLREAGVAAKVMIHSRVYVDVVPIRSGKDVALRYLEHRWGIDPSRIYYFGTYGNDVAVVRGRNLAALPLDADPELTRCSPRPRIYHASEAGLAGFFEGLDHYRFLDGGTPPKPDESLAAEDDPVGQSELLP
jgi:sucrose-phosphate synthase